MRDIFIETPSHPATDRTCIVAVVCDKPGQGIMARVGLPLVTMNPALRPSFEKYAAEAAAKTGQPIKVLVYVREGE